MTQTTTPAAAAPAQSLMSKILGFVGLAITVGPRVLADGESGYASIKSAPGLYERVHAFLDTGLTLLGDLKALFSL